MNAPARIRQQDADCLFKAARRAGFEQVHLRITVDGTIDFVAGPAAEAVTGGQVNPLDAKIFGDDTQAPPA